MLHAILRASTPRRSCAADRSGRRRPVRQGQPIPPGPPKYMKVPHVVGELFETTVL